MRVLLILISSFIILSFTFTGELHAIPDWVKNLRAVPVKIYDKKAKVVYLTNSCSVRIHNEQNARTYTHVAFKVLHAGADQYEALREYKCPTRKIENLKGWLLKEDGTNQELTDQNILESSKHGLESEYDEGATIVATFPSVPIGAIIAYEYEVDEKGEWTSAFQHFTFQIQQPVISADFSVEIPRGWSIHQEILYNSGVTMEKKDNTFTWKVSDLPFLPDEPLMPPWKYLAKQIFIVAFDSTTHSGLQFPDWKSVVRWDKEQLGTTGEPNGSITQFVQTLTKGLTTPEEKLDTLCAFVRDQIRYVAVEIAEGRFVPRSASATFVNRYGDCKDKTALLRAMLNVAGISSIAVFANPTEWVFPDLPTPFQFNHVIVGISRKDIPTWEKYKNCIVGDYILFDPTSVETPLGYIPVPLQGTRILLATEGDSILSKTPYLNPNSNFKKYITSATLDSTGEFHADITIKDFGYFAEVAKYMSTTMSGRDQLEGLGFLLSKNISQPVITDYLVRAVNDTMVITFVLQGKRAGISAGADFLLFGDIIPGQQLPFLTGATRVHPVWFGGGLRVESDISWNLADTWDAGEDSNAFQDSCRGAHNFFSLEKEHQSITIHSSFENTGIPVPPDEYESAKIFCKQMNRYLDLILPISHRQEDQ